MISESSTPGGDGPSDPAARPQTLAQQGLVNRVVRGLLRAPGLSRVVGNQLLTLYVVGRKSGKRLAIPVAYTRHDGALLIGTPFTWGRNLRTGEPVNIRLQGRLRTADVEVITDEAGVVALYDVITRANHHFADFNKIGLGPDGAPNPADLHRAWAVGARVIRLIPR